MTSFMKHDLRSILILICISLIIGIYLIATTVVISKDGVAYIERSKSLKTDFRELIKETPPIGFDLLIAGFHGIYHVLFQTADVQSRILSAQICTLTCKLIAIVVLYFLGKLFFNHRDVFMSLLVLSCLPYPTHFGVDVLRDWPHVLFLYAAMLFLVWGTCRSNRLYMVLAGLICGIGYIIRPECAQVVIYGIALLIITIGRSLLKKEPFGHSTIYLYLLAGFLLVFIPYSLKRDKLLPTQLNALFSISGERCHDGIDQAGLSIGTNVPAAGVELAQTIAENLHYYFAVPAAAGFYFWLSRKKGFGVKEHLLMLFIGFNCMLYLLLYLRHGYISRRHVLPLCALLVFYVPGGIHAMGHYLGKHRVAGIGNIKRWGYILAAVGIFLALPKTLRPLGQDKRIFREAAVWIDRHSSAAATFLTFDVRIPFYGKRENWAFFPRKRQAPAAILPDYLICESINSAACRGAVDTDYVLVKHFEDKQERENVYIFQRSGPEETNTRSD